MKTRVSLKYFVTDCRKLFLDSLISFLVNLQTHMQHKVPHQANRNVYGVRFLEDKSHIEKIFSCFWWNPFDFFSLKTIGDKNRWDSHFLLPDSIFGNWKFGGSFHINSVWHGFFRLDISLSHDSSFIICHFATILTIGVKTKSWWGSVSG